MCLADEAKEAERQFRALAVLTPDQLTDQEIPMRLMTCVETGAALVCELVYRHHTLTYLPSDQKYPIAHGEGRIEINREWRPIRLLFHPAGCTARGLTLEGEVRRIPDPDLA